VPYALDPPPLTHPHRASASTRWRRDVVQRLASNRLTALLGRRCVCKDIYIYISIYISTCTYIYIHIHVCATPCLGCMYPPPHMHPPPHMYVQRLASVQRQTGLRGRSCVCIHTTYRRVHTYIHSHMYLCVRVCIHTCMHAYSRVYVYIHIYTYIYIFVSMPLYFHTQMHTYIHTYVHTHIHTHTHTRTQTYTHSATKWDRLRTFAHVAYHHRAPSPLLPADRDRGGWGGEGLMGGGGFGLGQISLEALQRSGGHKPFSLNQTKLDS
jgi:hypothetical protein